MGTRLGNDLHAYFLGIFVPTGARRSHGHTGGAAAAFASTGAALARTFERVPNAARQTEGIEPDTLGLFTGPAFGDEEQSVSPLPPQIILFLENLWDFAEGNEEIFRAEVRTTYLHELGHYLGLDEDELTERGLA